MGARPPSLQEIIRRRQRGDFVGRERHRAAFRENFERGDADRKFLFSVHGQAGIGKSCLLRRLRAIAVEAEALATVTDDDELDPVTTMVAMARQLSDQGGHTRAFSQGYERYQRRRDELLTDPEAPSAARELLTSATVRMTVGAVKSAVPGLGFLAEAFTPEDVTDQVEKSRGFLSRKFSDHADVSLVLSPVEELTPLFVEDLRELSRHRALALMFDTFERTSPVLEHWLLRLLSADYGELPANLVLVVVGQHPLDHNRWGDYAPIIEEWPLEPFTEAEARDLLERRGVRDERVIEVILGLSGGLPLLVAMLAEKGPQDPQEIGDPSGNAVERFLKWETDPQHHEDALLGALPRGLDEDVLSALVGEERAPDVLTWLCDLPFVPEQHSHPHYHQVVREQMLRLQRSRSPRRFAERHRALAAHYAALASRLDLRDHSSCEHVVEQHYHLLCADAVQALPEALALAAKSAMAGVASAHEWALAIGHAGRDTGDEDVRAWGERLGELATDDSLISYVTAILSELPVGHKVTTLYSRAVCLANEREFDRALVDLDAALCIEPGSIEVHARRGSVHRRRRDYPAAIADFSTVLEADPDRDELRIEQASAHVGNNEPDSARALLTGVLAEDPTSREASSWLALVHRICHDPEEALRVLDRAIALSPDDSGLHMDRGLVLTELGRESEALDSVSQSTSLTPESALSRGFSGYVRGLLAGDLAGALNDLDRALHIDPDWAAALAWRGQLRFASNDEAGGLVDLGYAAELDPHDHAWLHGIALRLVHDDVGALEVFEHAVHLEPGSAWSRGERSMVHLSLGNIEDALRDLRHIDEHQPSSSRVQFLLGLARHATRERAEAEARFGAALELIGDPSHSALVDAHRRFIGLCCRIATGDSAGARSFAQEHRETELPVDRIMLFRSDLRALRECMPERVELVNEIATLLRAS